MKITNLIVPRSLQSSNRTSEPLEEIDLKILETLSIDCRMGYAKISRAVNLSRMAVRNRVMKMLESGLIERFSVIVNARKIGLNTAVFLEVNAVPSKLDSVATTLAKNNRIESVYATTGNSVLHVHAFLENFNVLESFMLDEIYKIDGITDINVHIMTKKYKGIRLFT